MLITEAHKEKIMGTLYCYDRISMKSTARMFGYSDGMGIFFNKISDFALSVVADYCLMVFAARI